MSNIKEAIASQQSKYLVTSGSDTGRQEDAIVNMTDSEAKKISQNVNVTASKLGPVNEEQETQIEQGDLLNLTKQLGAALKTSLKGHGDEIQTIKASHISPEGLTIKVTYKPDEEGQEWDDEFKFKLEGDKVVLDNGGQTTGICQITKRSGTLILTKEIAIENLSKFLRSAEKVNIQECGEEGLGLFSEAVKNYFLNKNKENLKELFRAARNFKGNTLKEKFKNGVEAYKQGKDNLVLGEEEPEQAISPVSVPSALSTGEAPVQVSDTVQITTGVLMKLLDCGEEGSDKYKKFEELLEKGKTEAITVDDIEGFCTCNKPEICNDPECPLSQPTGEISPEITVVPVEENLDQEVDDFEGTQDQKEHFKQFLEYWISTPEFDKAAEEGDFLNLYWTADDIQKYFEEQGWEVPESLVPSVDLRENNLYGVENIPMKEKLDKFTEWWESRPEYKKVLEAWSKDPRNSELYKEIQWTWTDLKEYFEKQGWLHPENQKPREK